MDSVRRNVKTPSGRARAPTPNLNTLGSDAYVHPHPSYPDLTLLFGLEDEAILEQLLLDGQVVRQPHQSCKTLENTNTALPSLLRRACACSKNRSNKPGGYIRACSIVSAGAPGTQGGLKTMRSGVSDTPESRSVRLQFQRCRVRHAVHLAHHADSICIAVRTDHPRKSRATHH